MRREVVVTCTGFGDWYYLGPADWLWTATYISNEALRWTSTLSADPESAAGRIGHPITTYELIQGCDDAAGRHIHVTGPNKVKIIVTGIGAGFEIEGA